MLQAAKEFRIGRPQILAGLMLLGFLAQCLWVAGSRQLSDLEIQYIASGETHELGQVYRTNSPLTGWIAALPGHIITVARAVAPAAANKALAIPRPWLIRMPFVIFGVWLGAALWWVSRRLFDDAGGYVALSLYSSSPAMVKISSNVGPEIVLAWSIFGLVYTAIGVAHTLYAPPRKWGPRTVILGLAIGFALAAARWSFTLVLMALAFMFYLAPGRRRSVLIVVLGAAVVALGVMGYFAWWMGPSPASAQSWVHPQITRELTPNLWFVLADDYVVTGFFIAALVTYASWPRARYFGNTAPLLTAFAAVLIFLLVPGIRIWKAPLGLSFVFVFIGGVAADLLETSAWRAITAILTAGTLLRVVLAFRTLGHWIHQNAI
jgi:hypothetical protein